MKDTPGPAFFSSFFPSLPQESRVGWGPKQHWKVTRLRRVLTPGLKAGMRQTSIHGTLKTSTVPSWQQGAHNGLQSWSVTMLLQSHPTTDTEDLKVSTHLRHLLWLSLLSMSVFALRASKLHKIRLSSFLLFQPLFCYLPTKITWQNCHLAGEKNAGLFVLLLQKKKKRRKRWRRQKTKGNI